MRFAGHMAPFGVGLSGDGSWLPAAAFAKFHGKDCSTEFVGGDE